ncbi:MAG: transposase [Acidimicrobiia bacterium]
MAGNGKRGRPPYPAELRQRAVRMVVDHQREYTSQWAAISAIAVKLGVHRETLRGWVRTAETDAGQRPGLTSEDRDRIKDLEREVRELRRTNEILKAAASFFGAELDRNSKK